MSRHRPSSQRHYPRTARLNELLREILGEELERIDEDRLAMVTITGVDCDSDLHRATVFYDSLVGADGDEDVLAAFGEVRYLLQRAVAKQTRIKRTPELVFRPDPAVRAAARLEEVLATLPPPRTADELLDEQKAYYRARAPEYELWWDREGSFELEPEAHEQWLAEIRELETAVAAAGISGSVLELAGGTGIWTRQLAHLATELTVVDASPEVLALNRQNYPPDGAPVTFQEVDLFDWEPSRRYDAVFFSFWLTHVPPGRFDAFWNLVERCLVPGGRFHLIDNARPGPGAAAPVDAISRRVLEDGREFDIVKQYHDPVELAERLAGLGWDATFTTTDTYFLHGGGTRSTSGQG